MLALGTMVKHVDPKWLYSTGVIVDIWKPGDNHIEYYVKWIPMYDKCGSHGLSTWYSISYIIPIGHIDFQDKIKDRLK